MISSRLPSLLSDRLKRIAGLDRAHLAVASCAALAVALLVATGLATARSGPQETRETAERVAAVTGGQFSQEGLRRLVASMDPSAVSLAERHDSTASIDDTPGWMPGDPPRLLQFLALEGPDARRVNEAIPFTGEMLEPAAPFFLKARNAAERERAVRCLANAIYYEAALEPVDGQRAVAQVVVNRVRDPNFPKSVCGVVYEGWERLTGCQFSFTCDGALVRAPIAALWRDARAVAEAALTGYVQKDVGSATHYHADYVAPYWAPTLVKINQIGAHIFYRWPGEAGMPQALTASYAGGELRLSEAVLTGRAPRPLAVALLAAKAAADNPLAATAVQVIDAATGEARTRVQATVTPVGYGRRQATADEIASINATLEARFPTKAEASTPAAPAAPAAAAAAAPATAPAPVATAADLSQAG